ncbi:YciI family protein [Flavobacterium pallidum]|uniref:Transcription initiation protein n=1 Tax=Flavobacterium pallidum TaxID=2172098 RepID=A0A2S1SE19_9FLAO|nr:YciI family protein [Flavobacterium pallidum]AWI24635.1 transcription initiation protein [Flavobacterium pallidum]
MKNFLFIFRADHNKAPQLSPEEMQANTKRWMDWIGSIAAQNKLVDRGNRLEDSGKIVKSSTLVTDGPYSEIKETIGGYTMIQADDYDEATELAKGCPIFDVGGHVEVREVRTL